MAEIIRKEINKDEIINKAQQYWDKGGRLLALNGYIDSEKQNVVIYSFEDEKIREMLVVKGEEELQKITGIYKGAAWFEEEIQEMMPVTFSGLKATGRLFLPEEFKNGDGKILVLPLDELKKMKDK